ncbi:hypothetical protein RhiirA5_424906 [Rhizophagus irregularis]|uniref:Uncharacterized protein n=1 Tax=Rhizophagus irregularis TaxID=588596 RepID=A0A2N0R3V2_9GLOM|nr:hypothetical protein RhiirA5_424906 [Rhizophagus irregularis]PKC57985.1 hypothetical protein RhiirA1_471652 [Rhizophagus irregularis]
MKFKYLLLIFVFTIILADAAPPLKRDANTEAQSPWERKRDADAEALSFSDLEPNQFKEPDWQGP